MATLMVAGLGAGALLVALVIQGSLVTNRGPVEVSYPAGEVKEVRVLDAVDVYVDGEPKLGASVFGSIALFMLATASFVTFTALRIAGAERRLRTFWLLASVGLALAAADELLALHESLGHTFPELADIPGVKRPDDFLLLLYLPAAAAFVWTFRDVLRAHRLTFLCMGAALACFGLSAAADLVSLRAEEWFELLAGLFIAAGLVALMHRHLTSNLQIRVRAWGPAAAAGREATERKPAPAEPALRR